MQIAQHVRVRGASWHIAEIRAYEDCQLVTLTARSPLLGPVERQVLAPFDDIEPVARHRRARFTRAGTWWRACRRLIAEDTPPGSLRSVHRADIDVLPHQLEPALAIVRGLGSRVLLADEVGLGKTVQAGIVVSELRARGAIERALVLAPAGLREQWVQELSTRFGLEAHLADAAALRRLSATLPLGVNPWITAPLAVVSMDYVKRPEVLPVLLSCHWDIVIVDEAHAAAGDSDRHSAVAALASRAAYVLLLTATPHSGDPRSFEALCRMGAIGEDELLVFRRRRTDVRPGAIRKIHALHVKSGPQEVRLHALLERYVAAVCAEHDGAWLAASVLHKRALSSAWSLARSVERRLEVLREGTSSPDADAAQQPALRFGNAEGEFSAADEEPGWPAGLCLRDRSRESRLLRSLHASARLASTRESKLLALVRLLRRCHEPAIVFTEYRDTLLHMRTVLGRPASLLHGGLTRAERAAAIADFASGRRIGSADDGRRRRRIEPASQLPPGHQSGIALESDAPRTAHRPRGSHRSAAHRSRSSSHCGRNRGASDSGSTQVASRAGEQRHWRSRSGRSVWCRRGSCDGPPRGARSRGRVSGNRGARNGAARDAGLARRGRP